MNADYSKILEDENNILSEVCQKQELLRKAVNDKDWPVLLNAISEMNLLMDEFNLLDEQRDSMEQKNGVVSPEVMALKAEVRGKLVKCRAENKALTDFLNITKNFVNQIINTALPQTRSRLYTRNGYIVQKQPASVVVNTLF